MRASERARERGRDKIPTRKGGEEVQFLQTIHFFFLDFPPLLSLNDTLKREDHIIDTAGAKLRGGEEKFKKQKPLAEFYWKKKTGLKDSSSSSSSTIIHSLP